MKSQDDLYAWCKDVDASGLIDACVLPEPQPRDVVVVALAGAYNTGKTSLIKRILHERGCPIPEELAVASDPTTFIPVDVPVGELILRDTPGLGSGKELHNARALDAAIDADALLLLLTPQLLSAADDDAWSLILGQAWGAPAPTVNPDWFTFAISRFDTAGPDPEQEREPYQALVTLKQRELRAILGAREIEHNAVSCLVIASDPFGFIGDGVPGAGAYAEGQGWDGIPDVLAWLDGVPSRLPELRAGRAVRIRARALVSLRAQLISRTPQLQAALSGGALRKHALNAHESQLTRLWHQCEKDLDEALNTAVGLDVRAATAPDRADLVKTRLRGALEGWGSSVADRLNQHAHSAPENVGSFDPPPPERPHLGAFPEGGSSTNPLFGALGNLRQNAAHITSAAEAFRALADSVPRLEPLGRALQPEVLNAAASLAELVWQLNRVEEKQEREVADRQRQHYLQLAGAAAQDMISPLRAWSVGYAEQLRSFTQQVAAETAMSEQVLAWLHRDLERIEAFLADIPT
jgi:hypothetical protein